MCKSQRYALDASCKLRRRPRFLRGDTPFSGVSLAFASFLPPIVDDRIARYVFRVLLHLYVRRVAPGPVCFQLLAITVVSPAPGVCGGDNTRPQSRRCVGDIQCDWSRTFVDSERSRWLMGILRHRNRRERFAMEALSVNQSPGVVVI